MYVRPLTITAVTALAVIDTAQSINIGSRAFIIENAGTQPLYIDPVNTATAATGFSLAAGQRLEVPITCSNLSVISNATGTTVNILYLE